MNTEESHHVKISVENLYPSATSEDIKDDISKSEESEELPAVITSVDANNISQLVEGVFDNNQITVARLGQVWAAFWRASSEQATNQIYRIKGRKPDQPFSVLGPAELIQSLIDMDRVLPQYVPLMNDKELLLDAINDKLFLRFPISVTKKEELDIPDSVVSLHENPDLGDPYYSMHVITGEDAEDYGKIQNAIAPQDLNGRSTEEMREYIQQHLVAITSWNQSGAGSNYDDYQEALELCRGNNIPMIVRESKSRGEAFGSYGILNMIAPETMKKGQSKVVRAAELKHNYWSGLLRNFVSQARKAGKVHGGRSFDGLNVAHSGF